MCVTTYTEVLAPTATSKSRAMTWQPAGDGKCGVLTISDKRSHTRYAVCKVPTDASTGDLFKLTKADGETYYVRAGGETARHCDCAGYSYGRGKACKHVDAVNAVLENRWIVPPCEPTPAEVETVVDVTADAEERDSYYQTHPIHEVAETMSAEKIETMMTQVNGPSVHPLVPTLRDQFAAAALTGLLSAHSDDTALPTSKAAAEMAYSYADPMLAHRCISAPR